MFYERLEKVLVVAPRLYTLQPFPAGTPTVTYTVCHRPFLLNGSK